MKKLYELKPYYDSLKVNSSPNDIFGIFIFAHIFVLLMNIGLFAMFEKPSLLVVLCLHCIMAIAYMFFAVKNRKKMNDDFVVRGTVVPFFMIALSFWMCNFALIESNIGVWVFIILMAVSFLVGCFINYIVAIRYVNKKNRSSNKKSKTISTGAAMAIAGIIGGCSYPLIRSIKFSTSQYMFIFVISIIFCSTISGYLLFMVTGKYYFEKIYSGKQ